MAICINKNTPLSRQTEVFFFCFMPNFFSNKSFSIPFYFALNLTFSFSKISLKNTYEDFSNFDKLIPVLIVYDFVKLIINHKETIHK